MFHVFFVYQTLLFSINVLDNHSGCRIAHLDVEHIKTHYVRLHVDVHNSL